MRKYSRTIGMHIYSLAMHHACALLQGRQRLLEGQKNIHQTSPDQVTKYTAIDRFGTVFQWIMGSSDYFLSRAKQ